MAENKTLPDYLAKQPGTSLTKEECRLVSCPACGAEATYKCTYPGQQDPRVRRQSTKIHWKRLRKAHEYRQEHRI